MDCLRRVAVVDEVLYGVNPHDFATFIVVPEILAVVTAIACVVPARRAARVDPLKVLRAN